MKWTSHLAQGWTKIPGAQQKQNWRIHNWKGVTQDVT